MFDGEKVGPAVTAVSRESLRAGGSYSKEVSSKVPCNDIAPRARELQGPPSSVYLRFARFLSP